MVWGKTDIGATLVACVPQWRTSQPGVPAPGASHRCLLYGYRVGSLLTLDVPSRPWET